MITVRQSDFNEVAKLWSKHLWDKRYDFKPTSCMLYLGGYDAEIEIKYSPIFLVAEVGGVVAGAVSGHATSSEHFRMRGLCVLPQFRGGGCGARLVSELVKIVSAELLYQILWTAPRETAWPVYEKLGFVSTSDFTNEGFLFGPNCYAKFDLAENRSLIK